MHRRIKKFLKLSLIEMEDLEEELFADQQKLEERYSNNTVTQHIFMENRSVLDREIRAVRRVRDVIDAFPRHECDDIENLEAFIKRIREYVDKVGHKQDLPDSIYHMLEDKIKKISVYMADSN